MGHRSLKLLWVSFCLGHLVTWSLAQFSSVATAWVSFFFTSIDLDLTIVDEYFCIVRKD